MSTGTTTDVLNMPKWPFALICLIGFVELTILILFDTIQLFIDAGKNASPKETENKEEA